MSEWHIRAITQIDAAVRWPACGRQYKLQIPVILSLRAMISRLWSRRPHQAFTQCRSYSGGYRVYALFHLNAVTNSTSFFNRYSRSIWRNVIKSAVLMGFIRRVWSSSLKTLWCVAVAADLEPEGTGGVASARYAQADWCICICVLVLVIKVLMNRFIIYPYNNNDVIMYKWLRYKITNPRHIYSIN